MTFPRPAGQFATEQMADGRCRYGPKSDFECNRRQYKSRATVKWRVKVRVRVDGHPASIQSGPESEARVRARLKAKVRARVAGVARPGVAGRETALEVCDSRRFGTRVRVRGSQESHPRSAERRACRLHDSGQAEQQTSEIPNHTGRTSGTSGFGQVSHSRSAESSLVRRVTADYLVHSARLSSHDRSLHGRVWT